MPIITRLVAILKGTDADFWTQVRQERGLRDPMLYCAALLVWFAALIIAYGLIAHASGSADGVQKFVASVNRMGLSPAAGIVWFGLAAASLYFVGAFVYAAWLHLMVKMMGGKGAYAQTYRAYVYGATPHLLFFSLPLLGFAGSLYSVYLVARGLSELHGFSLSRGFWACFLSGVLLSVLVGGIAILAILILARMPGVHFS
jgi:hypothetical protein